MAAPKFNPRPAQRPKGGLALARPVLALGLGLGGKAAVFASRDRAKCLRGALHHRAAMGVTVALQGMIHRHRAKPQPQKSACRLGNLQQQGLARRLQPGHGIVAADALKPRLRL